MTGANFINPVRELRTYIGNWANQLRGRRQFAVLLQAEVIADIASDVQQAREQDARDAHKAEMADLDALRLFELARDPKSPGGVLITPAEAAPILRQIRASAEFDHNISDRAIA